MSKHTPGPWEAVCNDVCVDGKILFLGTGEDYSKRAANARLIAAAPEMLEACVAAMRYDEAIRGCADDPDKMSTYCTAQGEDLDALYMDWVGKAWRAIAKAKGGE